MMKNSYNRRELLKSAGVAGVIAGSIPVFSQGSRASKKQEGMVNESTVPFFEFSLSLTDEIDAPKIDACSQFPSFVLGEENVYLTNTSFWV